MFNLFKRNDELNQEIKDKEQSIIRLQRSLNIKLGLYKDLYELNRNLSSSDLQQLTKLKISTIKARFPESTVIQKLTIVNKENIPVLQKACVKKIEELEIEIHTIGAELTDQNLALEKLQKEQNNLNLFYISIALATVGTAATAAFFSPQIVAGTTAAFVAAKPHLIGLGAFICSNATKLAAAGHVHLIQPFVSAAGSLITQLLAAMSAHKVVTATIAGVTAVLCFKPARESIKNSLTNMFDQIGKAHRPDLTNPRL